MPILHSVCACWLVFGSKMQMTLLWGLFKFRFSDMHNMTPQLPMLHEKSKFNIGQTCCVSFTLG